MFFSNLIENMSFKNTNTFIYEIEVLFDIGKFEETYQITKEKMAEI